MTFALRKYLLGLLFMLAWVSNPAFSAEDEAEEAASKKPILYYEIEPNILTFYQGTGKKLGYVVVQVTISVRGQENFDLVEQHLPLIQDDLIRFFNQQDKSIIQPFKERESLRLKAQASVDTVLKAEIGKNVVDNLLFTNYVYQ